MLIKEIVDVERIRKTAKHPYDSFSNLVRSLEQIGSGMFGTVYRSNKPGHVIKIASLIGGLNDPYVDYIRTIQRNQDNIFFPRIYNAKIYSASKTPEQHEIIEDELGFELDSAPAYLFVEMEKLLPLSDDKIRNSIPYLLEQLGLTDLNRAEVERKTPELNWFPTGTNTRDRIDDESDEYQFRFYISKLFRTFFSFEKSRQELRAIAQEVGNDDFVQALDALENLFVRHRADMHADNIMVRLTGSGPQLVIVDPVSPN